MNSTLLRLEAMDDQRFDLSKRRNPSNLVISTTALSAHWEEFDIPNITIVPPDSCASEETWIVNESSSSTDDSTSLFTTAIEPTILPHKNHAQSTDTLENDGYTATCTIIRPASPRSPILSIFSRPSSPVPGAISRPDSPLVTRPTNLNCMDSADGIEELNFIVQQRENDFAAVTQEIQVKVIQDQAVFYDEKWKDTIQAILTLPIQSY